MKDAKYYRALPYTRRVELVEEADGGTYFLASIRELPGVRGSGADQVEALTHLREAFEDYLDAMLSWGKQIPEPELWPESFGYDASLVRAVVTPKRASGRVAGRKRSAKASSWAPPEHTEWVDPEASLETALV